MTVSEKVAYIKGLAEGMKIDSSTNEGKLTIAILDVLRDIAEELEVIDEELDEMAEIVSDLEDAVDDLEDDVFGDDDDYDYDFDGDDMYEITCRKCENTVAVDMSVLEDGIVNCPNCGEKIEFDIEFSDNCDCCGDDDDDDEN
jgi:DNA-directed RNA polymerase subunit RPC12/RpoP